MKKSLYILLISLTVLACNLFATPTPQVEGTSLPPAEMNLQPLDFPELQEAPVEQPAASAILPEAIQQDQRAFVNAEQDLYVESTVFVVPAQTTRADGEIAKEIVQSRAPDAQILEEEPWFNKGQEGILVRIGGTCSADYSEGYVLVFQRRNVVVTIVACGDVSEEFIKYLADRIANRVNRPAAEDDEVAVKATIRAILTQRASSTETPTPEITLTPTKSLPRIITYAGEGLRLNEHCSEQETQRATATVTIHPDYSVTLEFNGAVTTGTPESITWRVDHNTTTVLYSIGEFSLTADYQTLTGSYITYNWNSQIGNFECGYTYTLYYQSEE